MTAFERMKLRDSKTGSDIREEWILGSQQMFDDSISDDPTYHEDIEILNKGLINARIDGYQLVQGTTPRMDIYTSLSSPVQFSLGDVVSYDNGFWIVIEKNDFHSIMMRGKLEECNYFLSWQNPKTLEVHHRWCSIRNPYSSGVTEERIINVEESKYKIVMPLDEESRLIHVNKRFLIGHQGTDSGDIQPKVYSVIEVDPVSRYYRARNEGFLVVNLEASEFLQDKDNAELMIADYKEPPPPQPAPVGSCSIEALGGTTIKQGGRKRVQAHFFDADNVEIPAGTIVPNWDLIAISGELGVVVNGRNDAQGWVELRANDNAVIGSQFKVVMTASDPVMGDFEAELVMTVSDFS